MAQTMADLLVAGGGKQQNAQEPVDSGYDFPEEGIPLAYLKSIRQAESNYGLPKNLLPRLFKIESNFNPKAVNPTSGASGIAQIMPKIHPNVDPFDAEASIDYAAKYLRELHDQHGDWEDALAAYGGFKDRGKAQGYINSVTGSKSMADLVGQDAGYGDTMADILRKGVTPTVNPLLSEYVDRANKSVASYAATEAMSEVH
jgi:soluble lytic murein transglycosylase-like protein